MNHKKYSDYVNHQVKLAFVKNDKARFDYYSERNRWRNQISKQISWIKKVLDMTIEQKGKWK